MKLFLYSLCIPISLFSQVGIGTQEIESGIILKVEAPNKGILIPRVQLQDLNSQIPITGNPKTGLLVYNQNPAINSGYYVWNESNVSWGSVFTPVKHSVAKFVNVDTKVDFNNGTNVMNIFDKEVFNDDNSLYEKYLQGIRIKETGLYKFTLNLDLDGTSDRDIFAIDGYINGQKIPETFYVSTVDYAGGSNEDIGYVFTTYVSIPSTANGSYVYFMGREVDGATRVYFKEMGTSSITIEKIR